MQNQFEQQQINTDPRERGYNQEYIHPYGRERRRGGLLRPLVVVLILLAVLAAAGWSAWGYWGKNIRGPLAERTFNVSGQTKLVINSASGDVHIHSGQANKIIVKGTKFAYGPQANLNNLDLTYEQQGDSLSIGNHEQWSLLGGRGIDIDVAVPENIAIEVHTSSGDLAVEDVTGTIETEIASGDIRLSDATGEMNLSTHSGDIRISDMHLQGSSSLTTSSGDIIFNGTLDPQRSTHINATSGDVRLKLPANSSFKLNAKTTSGDIHNEFGSTTVGNAPQPDLDVQVTSGDIVIEKD